jgi:hypothetical protein
MPHDVAVNRTLPVLVAVWQFECCGDPFAVGEEVLWRLSFATDLAQLDEARTTLHATVGAELISDAGGTTGSLLTADGLTAWLRPPQPPGPFEVSGELIEDHHGLVPEEVPRTRGTITRIRAVSLAYTRNGAELTPIPGSQNLRDLPSLAAWTETAPDTTTGRQESTLLVDLAIDTRQ